MGKIGAECDRTFTSKRRSLSKPEWDKERVGQLCTDSSNVANLKAAILKMCGDTNMCTQEVMDYVNSATARVGAIAAIAITAKGVSGMELKRSLKSGDYGDDFQELRKLLLYKGYSTSDEDTFGYYTRRMVIRFQMDNGISPDGVVGPATWSLLNSNISMLKTPWMESMNSRLGESFITGSAPTRFNREVFSHTDCPLGEEMLPGCAATVCWALEINGYISTHDASAISYKGFGIKCDPQFGCFVVIEHLSGELKGHHHVGFFVKFDTQKSVLIRGGNQARTLCERSFSLETNKIVYTGLPVLKGA